MKDRISQNPGRVLVKPENGGAQYYATLERADNPIQEGDALNKANLLTDATAALLGLGENAVPDDAFRTLGEHRWRRRVEERGVMFEPNYKGIASKTFSSGATSSSATIFTLYYADDFTYSDGTFALVDPQSKECCWDNYLSASPLITNKYFMVNCSAGEVLYYGGKYDGAGSHIDAEATTGAYNIVIYNLVIKSFASVSVTEKTYDIIGEYEYVTSPNRHAYPDSGREGIFTYEYLGAPLDNAKEAYGMRLHWWKRRTEESGYVVTETVAPKFSGQKTDMSWMYEVAANAARQCYHSDSYEYVDGQYKLTSYTTTTVYASNSQNMNSFRGRYVLFSNPSNVMYYCADDANCYYAQVAMGDAPFALFVDGVTKYESTYYENIGEYEYLSSPNRNAYPDSGTEGIFSYQYLAVPFENAREGAKVVTGSYAGTGTYGPDNPNSLTFATPPKMLLIGGMSTGYAPMPYIEGDRSFVVQYGSNTSVNPVTINGTTISWYGGNAAYQLNMTGFTYPYFAIL